MGAPMVCLPSGSFSHQQTCSTPAWTATSPATQTWTARGYAGFALCARSNLLVLSGGDITGSSVSDVWSSPATLGALSWTSRTALPYTGGHKLLCNAAERLVSLCFFGVHQGEYVNSAPASSSWTTVVPPYPARGFCSAQLVPSSGHMDHIMMAGYDGLNTHTDVWRYSAAADSYTLVCAAAPWAGRSDSTSAYANERTLIFGGGYPSFDDVWQSHGQTRAT